MSHIFCSQVLLKLPASQTSVLTTVQHLLQDEEDVLRKSRSCHPGRSIREGDEDTKNVDKENMIHEETSSEATQGKTNKGRRTKKAESSEESAEKHTSYLSFLVRHHIF